MGKKILGMLFTLEKYGKCPFYSLVILDSATNILENRRIHLVFFINRIAFKNAELVML